ncbi:hypothetical protein L6E12_26375 [Actinokineospora sp. PR83]|uniref:hypothetical protein n=1 Tax=Actinokineospora sp. PR83 TaxID=2884908 RepID=UPI001F264257|nr:hypothetical protein [Actinokineospora sp. PR83]MCG8919305.1 hypothetical protein [Actinokineospora sp. PR83]
MLLSALLLLGGCGSGAEDLVRRAAGDFLSAVAGGDAARACELLTDEAREDADCGALGITGGEVEQVEVWGDAARVRTASGVFFLRELAVGWRISGAGCEPGGDRPYECEVGGR